MVGGFGALLLLAALGCGSGKTTDGKAAADKAAVEKPVAAAPADETAAKPAADASTDKAAANPPADATNPTPAATAGGPPAPVVATEKPEEKPAEEQRSESSPANDYSSLVFVFMLSTFIGLGVILRVSRLLHTPLMSLTNAISAIAVVGAILVVGNADHPWGIRLLGMIALFASTTNIVSGFLITDRMLKLFKTPGQGGKR